MLRKAGWLIAGMLLGVAAVALYRELPRAFESSRGEALVVARAGGSVALDPAVVTDQESLRVAVNIFDTLVRSSVRAPSATLFSGDAWAAGEDGFHWRFAMRRDAEAGAVTPGLAEAWAVSEDGLRWRFSLRRDVKFHDGTAFDAEAVVFNFKRWMHSSNPYHVGSFHYWSASFGGFPGIVREVRALTRSVVEIELTEPYALLLETLSLPAFGMASPDAIVTYNESFKQRPVGTGPFAFESWAEDGTVTLRRNPSYWEGAPRLERIEFRTVLDEGERLRGLAEGRYHIVEPMPEYYDGSLDDTPPYRVVTRPFFNIGYLAMNNLRAPLDSRAVREAVAHAVDREEMLRVAFRRSTRLASTFLPPSLWGYHEGVRGRRYDPTLAEQLLREAGYDGSAELTLLATSTPRLYYGRPVELAYFIRDKLAAVGIKVRVNLQPWARASQLAKAGEYDLFLAGWTGDIPDPDNFLYTMFHSNNTKQGLVTNYSFYMNPVMDSLLDNARHSSSRDYRQTLYRNAQELLYSDVPALPLVHTSPQLGVHQRVRGYLPTMSGLDPLFGLSLSPAGGRP